MGSKLKQLTLRAWQAEALEEYYRQAKRDFLAVVTPGGGKTIWALSVVTQLRKMRRLIIVCPTTHIKGQWMKAARDFGLNVSDFDRIESNHMATTYAQVANRPEDFKVLVEERETAVIFDEIHHASDQKSWGSAIQEAFEGAYKRIALTGTAFRSDGDSIPFVEYVDGMCSPDYVYGYGDAVQDKICRVIEWPILDGEIGWRREGQQEKFHSFADELPEKERRARLRASLDPTGGFMRAMLEAADERLNDFPGQGGLLIAKSIIHAKELAKVLADVCGVKPVVVHSQAPSTDKRIEAFRNGTGRWLVSVDMISEGIDIPRLRVLVYATNKSTELYFRQAMGRVVRGSGLAVCYLPAHDDFLRMASDLREEKLHVIPPEKRGGNGVGNGVGSSGSDVEFVRSSGQVERVIRIWVDEPEEAMSEKAAEIRDGIRQHSIPGVIYQLPNDLSQVMIEMLNESRSNRQDIESLQSKVLSLLDHLAVWAHPDSDPVLSGDAAAKYCGVGSPKTMIRAAKAGELAYVQTGEGGRVRYRLSALNAWLETQTTPTRSSNSRDLADIDWGM